MRSKHLAAAAIGMLGFACSSLSPVPDQNVQEFCADWASAICQLSNGPCGFVASVCVSNQTTVCNAFASAGASATRLYNPSNGKACIDALKAAYATAPSSISASTLASLNATCNRAFSGNQMSDLPCTSDYDCSGNLICAPLVGQTGRVCATPHQKNPGDLCGTGDQCQDNTYCAPQPGAAPKCVPTPVRGAACNATTPCGTSDRCVAGVSGGVCQARSLAGQSCASNVDCDPSAPYCDIYPPAACTNGLTFARGSIDCNGIENGIQAPSSGGTTTGGATDAGSGG